MILRWHSSDDTFTDMSNLSIKWDPQVAKDTNSNDPISSQQTKSISFLFWKLFGLFPLHTIEKQRQISLIKILTSCKLKCKLNILNKLCTQVVSNWFYCRSLLAVHHPLLFALQYISSLSPSILQIFTQQKAVKSY